jgi:hypothetical protein
MMENLNLEQLKQLSKQNKHPAVSIFMPTHRAGHDAQQDPIRYKNLLRDAEQRLAAEGWKPRELEAFMRPARELQDNAEFWRHQREGLAVYLAEDDFHEYRLPLMLDEQLIIAQSYYVKPILPLFTNNGRYFILAVSQNDVRLFEATRHSLGLIELPDDVPTSLDEALRLDDPEKQLQFHTGTAPAVVNAGLRAGMFHGHDQREEERKERIERYLNVLDKGIRTILPDQKAPLVLAGVDYLLPIYRSVSEYPNIVEGGIIGNPEFVRPEELQAQAWPIVEPYFARELEEVFDEYGHLSNTNRATDHLQEIVAAAHFGRIDKLVLAADANVWGKFDEATGMIVHQQAQQSIEDDLPLLDYAAMQTLDKGGAVYALSQSEMPENALALAVLRY